MKINIMYKADFFRKVAQTFPEHPDKKSPKNPAEQNRLLQIFKIATIPMRENI